MLFIRHLWQLKTAGFLHWCLICSIVSIIRTAHLLSPLRRSRRPLPRFRGRKLRPGFESLPLHRRWNVLDLHCHPGTSLLWSAGKKYHKTFFSAINDINHCFFLIKAGLNHLIETKRVW